ncbi:hypothetical protein SAM23877_6135 [Streptomyces ambofaciens ATCC 23877]|uniref:Uncharacterized protein n=1 Tax=Streptomyces ambofaciens (strain ATCC 23877 / 3486 / DSM 40053 / JCM 4204 / NBRC 12836 / NRRL B-2516) TaxID=278992 RepID=A0A0K2B1D0_STRA7|nr:hypothetical protein [Streptomyces ambofaciens]AKZ59180.1 hypothetical protein SAM23877_6135 [Streptomyces ambofaciens ATCC 23877]WNA15373.1 hypothetical protein SAMYPH_42 [Streptomyces phage Samy]
MKYIDRSGDTWEDVSAGIVRIVVMGGEPVKFAEPWDRDAAEEKWGPFAPGDTPAEPQEAPSPVLPTVEGVMSRASVFQSAHALVTGLAWGDEEKPSVYDVLSVAKWLEGDE